MKRFCLSIALYCLFFSTAQAAIHANYGEVKETLRKIVARTPLEARRIEIGVSDSGETIEGIEIGKGALRTLVVAAHHGNEYGSVEVALGFAESIALRPIEGQTVTVIPVLNVAGFNRRSRWESNRSGSHDPNRDYPGPCGSEGPFNLKSTKALADYIDRSGVVTLATLHTYYPGVAYPWGLSSRDLETPYTETFRQLADLAVLESKYPTGNGTELIYPADGTFEDYAFWKHGIWSFLFELGFTHYPSEAEIERMKEVNIPGIRRLLEEAPRARAERHEFSGECDWRLRGLDRHDE